MGLRAELPGQVDMLGTNQPVSQLQERRFTNIREYLMDYRGPGFLADVGICSFPLQSPPPLFRQVSSTVDTQESRDDLSYVGEKTLSSTKQ